MKKKEKKKKGCRGKVKEKGKVRSDRKRAGKERS